MRLNLIKYKFDYLLECKLGNVLPITEQGEEIRFRNIERSNKLEQDKKNSEKEKLNRIIKSFPCIPNSPIKNDLYKTLLFLKENKEVIKKELNCSDELLLFLFKLSIFTAFDQTLSGRSLDDNEEMGQYITKIDSIISRILNIGSSKDTLYNPVMSLAKKNTGGKEASVGTYEMQPSKFSELQSTHKITGTRSYESDKLYSDNLVATIAVMEYYIDNYRKIKNKNGYSGPSVDSKGVPIPGLTGDYNWDVAICSYRWNIDDLLGAKFCKTKTKEGVIDTNWAAPCNSTTNVYKPTKLLHQVKIKHDQIDSKSPLPTELFINKGQVIQNYFPILLVTETYSTVTRIKNFFNYSRTNLSCLTI